MTHFWPHNEVEQWPRYRRASNPTLEVVRRQKYSKIAIFYYFIKARGKARSSTPKARSSNTKIEHRLGLGSSSKMKSSKSSKLDNFRLVAPLLLTTAEAFVLLVVVLVVVVVVQKMHCTNLQEKECGQKEGSLAWKWAWKWFFNMKWFKKYTWVENFTKFFTYWKVFWFSKL